MEQHASSGALWSQGCCHPSSAAVSATTQHIVLILRVKPPDIKNDTRMLVSFYCCLRLSKRCGFFLVLFGSFTCSYCAPAEPQSPLVDIGSIRHVPQIPLLSFGQIQSHPLNMTLFLNQLTFLSSSEMALEGQIRAGLSKK